jgi:hypothetical protein
VSVSFCPLPRQDLVLQVSTMLRRVAGCVRRQGKAASRGSVQCLHAFGDTEKQITYVTLKSHRR